jgi:pimeloyl-ACP methyl ester carboxylesterase
MTTPKSTFVLVPGGWHTPASYTALNDTLTSSGYTIHIPSLPSMSGARPPVAGLKEDTAHIRTYVTDLLDTGNTLAVIMHSYSGQVGTNALAGLGLAARKKAGLPGGISHLIYMSANAQLEGTSMIDTVIEHGHEKYIPLAFDFADDMSVLPRDPMYLIGAASGLEPSKTGEAKGLKKEVVEAYARDMVNTRWNGRCMYDEIEKCAWRESGVKVAYVMYTEDTCVPIDYQKGMIEKVRAEGVEVRVWEVKTGHCANITATEEVAKVLEEIVA